MNVNTSVSSSNIQNYSPNFKGNLAAKLTEVIPDTKVCKNLTKLDKRAFNVYAISKKYALGVTPQDINELSKFDGGEFVVQSYEFLCKKMGIPQSIRPPVVPTKIEGEMLMAYSPAVNLIAYDPNKISNFGKHKVFSMIRHEFQHFLQNTQILRHEIIGKKSVDLYTKNFIEANKNSAKCIAEKYSKEDIVEAYLSSRDENTGRLLKVKEFLDNNNTDGFNKLFDDLGEVYRKELVQLRANTISVLGEIKEDSSLTPKIQKYLDEFNEIGYLKPDGQIDYKVYLNTKTEQDAMKAQIQAEFEFIGEPCFMRYAKRSILESLEREQTIKIMNAVGDDLLTKK